jgi:hypothetical protein
MILQCARMRVLVTSCMVVALTWTATGPAFAAQGPRKSAIGSATAGHAGEPSAPPYELGPMSNAEVEGYGCLTSGGIAMTLGALAGSDELILVLAGGSLIPTTAIGVALAVTGTIFASFCAVGAMATPAIMRTWHQYYDGAELAAVRYRPAD